MHRLYVFSSILIFENLELLHSCELYLRCHCTQTIAAATVAPAATETTSVQADVGQIEAVQELDGLVDLAVVSQTSSVDQVADCTHSGRLDSGSARNQIGGPACHSLEMC